MNESRAEESIEIPGKELFFFAIKDTFRNIIFYGFWFGIIFAAYDNDIQWATWIIGLPLLIIIIFDLIQFSLTTMLASISVPANFIIYLIKRNCVMIRDQAYVSVAYIVRLIEKIFYLLIVTGCVFILFI